ncbi:hypothetical protein GFY24_36995 [Nocardia sp. SYP-A9097]|uniref:hypothetical protein n=1 Tax=Nocardia sp. SYP-A9097 TaxID=2663237 RepID=UPI00129A3109|nr:hypothetical protein [Nocardia sp. SYP-A9097]MRH92953.1 hypothetical protein [Nocardia sp. SYP-A9097]
MKHPRLKLMLLLSVAVVVITVTVFGVNNDRGHPSDVSSPPSGKVTPSEGNVIDPTGVRGIPTTDLFGNRLEVPADPAGEPLAQDPAWRPDPEQSNYLTVAPSRLRWQRGWGGAALPVSGSDGPTSIERGVASGFADTPQGAALAACDAIARAFAAPDDIWPNVVRARYLGGGQPLVDRIAQSRAETPTAATYLVVPEGIRILPGYRADFAVVQIAVRASGGWAYANWPMAWHDGDWRVRVPDAIESLWDPAIPVGSLIDFGSWKGTTS